MPVAHRPALMLAAHAQTARDLAETMRELRESGLSLREIAHETNFSIPAVSVELQRLGCSRRPVGRARQLSDELVALRSEGFALRQIADKTNLSVSTISMELARRNFTSPFKRVQVATPSRRRTVSSTSSSACADVFKQSAADETIAAMRSNGKTVQQIAMLMCMNVEVVWSRMLALNLTQPVSPPVGLPSKATCNTQLRERHMVAVVRDAYLPMRKA